MSEGNVDLGAGGGEGGAGGEGEPQLEGVAILGGAGDESGTDDGKGGDPKILEGEGKGDDTKLKDEGGEGEGDKGEGSDDAIDYGEFEIPQALTDQGMTMDTVGLEMFTAIVTEHKVSKEAAHAMFALHTEQITKVPQAMLSQQREAWVKKVNEGRDSFNTDDKFGGEKLGTSKAEINRALVHLAEEGNRVGPRIVELMQEPGRSNNNDPLTLMLLSTIGNMISEAPAGDARKHGGGDVDANAPYYQRVGLGEDGMAKTG